MRLSVAAVPFALLATPAFAIDPFETLDLQYLVDSSLTRTNSRGITNLDDSGNGYALTGRFRTGDQSYFYAEYQTIETDDTNSDVKQLRAAIGGHSLSSGGSSTLYAQFGYVSLELPGIEPDGYSAHVGLALGSDFLHLFGEVGYLDLDDYSAIEYSIGARLDVDEQTTLFAQYRVTPLEAEDDSEIELTDFKVGISVAF